MAKHRLVIDIDVHLFPHLVLESKGETVRKVGGAQSTGTGQIQAFSNISQSTNETKGKKTDKVVNPSNFIDNDIRNENDRLRVQSSPDNLDASLRNSAYNWKVEKHFKTMKEAHKYLKDSGYTVHFQNQKTKYYRCDKVLKTEKRQCKSKKRIRIPSNTSGYLVECNSQEHDHDSLVQSKVSHFTNELKQFIVQSRKESDLPKKIIRDINKKREDENMFLQDPTPAAKQIYSLENKENKKFEIKYLGQLAEWCDKKSGVPENDDVPFVLGSEISEFNSKMDFKCVLSTKRLLLNAKDINILWVDATYKLNYQGFPLLVVGTIDKNKSFHLIAICCCVHEREEDFNFFFKTVAKAVKTVHDIDLQPEIMVSDAADAIRNSFFNSFASAKLDIMCYAHVVRNIRKQRLQNRSNMQSILNDVRILQRSNSKERFKVLCELFCKKWQAEEPEFVAYFQKVWLGRHCNWFEGSADYTPSTNNALESFNNRIKREITKRKRLPFGQFMEKMTELLNNESLDYKYNLRKKIALEPSISPKDFKKAFEYASNIEQSIESLVDVETHYTAVLRSQKLTVKSKGFEEINTASWDSFDDYVQNGFDKFYEIILCKQKDEFKTKSKCTCIVFQKHYQCKHILALALHQDVLR